MDVKVDCSLTFRRFDDYAGGPVNACSCCMENACQPFCKRMIFVHICPESYFYFTEETQSEESIRIYRLQKSSDYRYLF